MWTVQAGPPSCGIADRIGDDYLLGHCHHERAWFAEGEGRLDDAERDFRVMLAIFERLHDGAAAASAHDGLGAVHVKRGELAAALAEYDALVEQYARLGARVREGCALRSRAHVLAALGRHAEADADRARGEALVGDAPVPWSGPGSPAIWH